MVERIFTPRWNDFYLMMERINIRQAGRYYIRYPYLYCIVKKGHSLVCMLDFYSLILHDAMRIKQLTQTDNFKISIKIKIKMQNVSIKGLYMRLSPLPPSG